MCVVALGGRSRANAMELATPEQVAKMRALGLNREIAENWRNFYGKVYNDSLAKWADTPDKINPSALSRANLFQYYMDNL